jgi:hypothetical protein
MEEDLASQLTDSIMEEDSAALEGEEEVEGVEEGVEVEEDSIVLVTEEDLITMEENIGTIITIAEVTLVMIDYHQDSTTEAHTPQI